MKKRDLKIKFFSSFEEESITEYKRRSSQSHKERMAEFAQLQERCWGKSWTKEKIKQIVSFEKVAW